MNFINWRLGFRQSSFRHITRVPQRPTFDAFAVSAAFLACYCPLHLSDPGKPSDPGIILQFLPAEPGICHGASWRTIRSCRAWYRPCDLGDEAKRPQCLGMMTFTNLPSVPSDHPVPFTDQLWLAVAAYLARFKGASRYHTESDLRCYLGWCAERSLDPLAARRPHLELYIRRMQEIRRFKPSTVSRRFSVAAGFYRTCVIDGLLEHYPSSMSVDPPSRQNRQRWGSPTCSSRRCSPPPGNRRTRATSRW